MLFIINESKCNLSFIINLKGQYSYEKLTNIVYNIEYIHV